MGKMNEEQSLGHMLEKQLSAINKKTIYILHHVKQQIKYKQRKKEVISVHNLSINIVLR